ncbi:MAG: hypothetical protein RSD40_05255 [Bacilli bacterium]
MIEVDFTLSSKEGDFKSYINNQYKIVKEAIKNSKNIELITTFESLCNGNIDSFSDVEWKFLSLPQLELNDKVKLGLIENNQNLTSTYDEYLQECMLHLMKKSIICELEPKLLIVPNQSDVEETDKLVRLKFEFN